MGATIMSFIPGEPLLRKLSREYERSKRTVAQRRVGDILCMRPNKRKHYDTVRIMTEKNINSFPNDWLKDAQVFEEREKMIRHLKTVAHIADAVYMDSEQAIKGLLLNVDTDIQTVKMFENDNAVGVCIEHEEFVCFAFRGTNDIKDWFSNVHVGKHKRYHQGFVDETMKVWSDMYNYWLANNTDKLCLFVGHSLGGAMALVAWDLWYERHKGKKHYRVITFGCPRVFRKDVKIQKHLPIYRFRNTVDPVPRVPTMLRFKHVGKLFFIDHDNQVLLNPPFWVRAKEVVQELYEHPRFWREHFMRDYIRELDIC